MSERYNTSKIDKILTDYVNDMIAVRIQTLNIDLLQKDLIEGHAIAANKLSGIPYSVTNRLFSKTENIAIILAELEDSEKKQILEKSKRIMEIELQIARRKETDRFLIYNYIEKITINSESWEDIADLYTKRFHYITVRAIHYRLFRKILPWLEQQLKKN
jgi:hypothetical protein